MLVSFLLVYSFSFAQDKLVKDLDGDTVKDTVLLDQNSSEIVCKLSSNKFREMRSKPINTLNAVSGFEATKNGFQFTNDWMRVGYKNQFRYNKKTKKMQLIGMSQYLLGNAALGGSGEVSVNLLNGDFLGNLNYFDPLANNEQGELVPVKVKGKMRFPEINLEDFEQEIYFDFDDRSNGFYESETAKIRAKRKGEILYTVNVISTDQSVMISVPQNSDFEFPDNKFEPMLIKSADFNADGKIDLLVNLGACGTGGCMVAVFLKKYGDDYSLAFLDYLKNAEYEKDKNGNLLLNSSEEIKPYDPSFIIKCVYQLDPETQIYGLIEYSTVNN